MSRSVIMPISLSFSATGKIPISACRIIAAASRSVRSGAIVCTPLLIALLTFMAALLTFIAALIVQENRLACLAVLPELQGRRPEGGARRSLRGAYRTARGARPRRFHWQRRRG